MKTYALLSSKILVALLLVSGMGLKAGDGTWNNTRTGNQNWGATGNWIGGEVADGIGAVATLNAATSASININMGSVNRTLGEIHVVGVTSSSNAFNISGTGVITLNQGDGSVPVLDISGNASSGLNMGSNVTLAGNHGFEKKGSGRLYLTKVDVTGEIVLTEGVLATVQSLGAASPLVFNGTGATWQPGASEAYTNDIIMRNGDAIISGASSEVVLAGRILQEDSAGESRNVIYVNSAGGSTNLKKFVVSGDNDYQGTTTIGGTTASATVVHIQHNHALGQSNADVVITGPEGNDQNTLELSGGVTVSGKTLTLNGRGYEVRGSLRSISGNNEWAGNVQLGTTENTRIGVDADRLIISGEVSGSSAGGLAKVGDGVLELNQANTYSSGTNVIRGTVHANHNQALGTGVVELRNDSVLLIGEDIQAQVSALSFISNNAKLAFDMAGEAEASIWISGNLNGANNYVVDILNSSQLVAGEYTLMTVEGTWNAAGFTLGEYAGSIPATLDWSDGVLSLQVIPEPQSALIAIGVLLLGAVAWRKVKA